MRALLAIVIVAALAWSGFWFWQAQARDRAVTDWLAERRAAGWVAEAAEVRVTGYPNRADLIVTGLDLADPEEGWSWQAEELQVLALSYKPHHVIAVLPGEQVVATPYDTIRVTSDLLRGSVIFRPTPRLELDHATFEIEGMRLAGDSGWTAGIGKAILATRQAGATPFAHDVAFDAEGLALPPATVERIGGVLPAEIGQVGLDVTLAFDRPWDRPAIEGDNPVLEGVEVRDLSLAWGRLDLRGRGTLERRRRGLRRGPPRPARPQLARDDRRRRDRRHGRPDARRRGPRRPRPHRPLRRRRRDAQRPARLLRRQDPPRPDPARPGPAAGATLRQAYPRQNGTVKRT